VLLVLMELQNRPSRLLLGLGCLPVVARVAHAYGHLRSSARQISR